MTVTVTLCIWFRLLILVLSPSLLLSLSGDIEGAVETLENVYTQKGDTSRDVSISFVFRKVIEQKNDQALDKCKTHTHTHTHTHSSTHTHTCGSSLYMLSFLFWVSWKPSDWRPSLSLVAAMAERLANHFASYRAASDLFLQYVDSGLNEEAKFLLMVSPSALSLSLSLSHTHTQTRTLTRTHTHTHTHAQTHTLTHTHIDSHTDVVALDACILHFTSTWDHTMISCIHSSINSIQSITQCLQQPHW